MFVQAVYADDNRFTLSSENERAVFLDATDVEGWITQYIIYVYMWDREGNQLCGEWPGMPVTATLGGGHYKFVVPDEFGEIDDGWSIIWTFEGVWQTDDLPFVNHSVYKLKNGYSKKYSADYSTIVTSVYGENYEQLCLSSEEERAVFFAAPYSWAYYGTDLPVYAYLYDGEENYLSGSWPGTQAIALGNGYYKFIVPDKAGEMDDTWKIVWSIKDDLSFYPSYFNNYQTEDLQYVNNAVYDARNNMTKEDDGNIFLADQTAVITNICEEQDNGLCLSTENERAVFFKKPELWTGDYTHVYMWDGEGKQLCGNWPGTPAMSLGNGYYKFVVPNEAGEIDGTWQIIWNNQEYQDVLSTLAQTEDAPYTNQTLYETTYLNGTYYAQNATKITKLCSCDYTDYCLSIEDERAVFLVAPEGWEEDVTVYIWDEHENEICGNFPGMSATNIGNGKYKFVVPDNANEIDCSWQITWVYEKGFVQSSNMAFVNHMVYNTNNPLCTFIVTNHCEPQQDLVLKDNKRASYYTALAEDYNGKTLNSVTLNRQFKEGQWATLCMPFNVNQAQMRAQGLYGHVFEFRYAEKKDGESVVLYFSTAKSIQAGKGYIVSANSKLAEKSSFIFQNVTIDMSVDEASEHNIVNQSGYNDASGRSILSLVGTLRTGLLQGTEGDNVYLGLKNNQLYYPNTSEGTEIRAYRGFFRSNEPLNMQRVRVVMEETTE